MRKDAMPGLQHVPGLLMVTLQLGQTVAVYLTESPTGDLATEGEKIGEILSGTVLSFVNYWDSIWLHLPGPKYFNLQLILISVLRHLQT